MKYRSLTILILAVTLPLALSGQGTPGRWSVGAHLGFMLYSGDYSHTLYIPNSGFSTGLSVARYLDESFDLLVDAGFCSIQGDDNGARGRDRNLHFDASVWNATMMLKFKFNNGTLLKKEARWAPYLAAGAGIIRWNSSGWGLDESNKNLAAAFTNPWTSTALFSIAPGVTYRITNRLRACIQPCIWFPLTDAIDGWHPDIAPNEHNDRFWKISVGIVYQVGKK